MILAGSVEDAPHVRVDKVLTDEEQRLIKLLRQRVGKAVTKIEPRGMPTSLAKAPVRFSGNGCLVSRYRFDNDVEIAYQFIEPSRVARIGQSIHYDCRFEKAPR